MGNKPDSDVSDGVVQNRERFDMTEDAQHGVDTHQCEYCGRDFDLKDSRERHENIHESGYWSIPQDVDPSQSPTVEEARRVAEDVKEHGTVISLTRMGANPMLRYTPYRNNRGALVDMWSCISYYFERMPEATALNSPHIVRPWELDDWEVNLITTPWGTAHRKMRVSIGHCELCGAYVGSEADHDGDCERHEDAEVCH